MGMLLAFLPFMTFAAAERVAGIAPGLLAATAAALIPIGRDVLRRRAPKVLEAGTVLLFGGLAVVTLAAGATWSVLGVQLAVNAGLLAIVLLTLAIGRPFTLQYARERVAPELWERPAFRRANTIITVVWTAAFAAMVTADLIWVSVPHFPAQVGAIVTVVALAGAIRFSAWYPAYLRRDSRVESGAGQKRDAGATSTGRERDGKSVPMDQCILAAEAAGNAAVR